MNEKHRSDDGDSTYAVNLWGALRGANKAVYTIPHHWAMPSFERHRYHTAHDRSLYMYRFRVLHVCCRSLGVQSVRFQLKPPQLQRNLTNINVLEHIQLQHPHRSHPLYLLHLLLLCLCHESHRYQDFQDENRIFVLVDEMLLHIPFC